MSSASSVSEEEEDPPTTHGGNDDGVDEPAVSTVLITPNNSDNDTTTVSGSINGDSGGFFSLGESNVAERARKLKEEQQAAAAADKLKSPAPATGDSHPTSSKDKKAGAAGGGATAEEDGDVHEFDSLFIWNQVDQKDNVFYTNLAQGFRALREGKDGDEFTENDPAVLQARSNRQQYAATVNFIDPTTKSTPTSTAASAASNTPRPTNFLQQQSMFQKQESTLTVESVENVYEKITYIFQRDYGSTLRSVQYKNIRTGENEVIASLPVNPVITRTGAAAASAVAKTSSSDVGKSVNTPWGGTASTAIVPVSDPSEWHTGPLCHVYIAACENMDHYKTRVRPALQAFVSQIESAASNTTANQSGGHSADYLIVYIPVGGGASATNLKDSAMSPDAAAGGTSGGGLFQRARKRFGGMSSGTVGDDEDGHSKGSLDSGDDHAFDPSDIDDPDVVAMTVALNLLSRSEKNLYKRIVSDFPNGKACVLSTASLDRSDEEMSNSDNVAIRTQEWNTFNRMLGAVIVNGFMDRLRRYKDELKRLDAQRAIAATAAKNQQGGGIGSKLQKPNPYAFNLSHFFLVKESLAFTYEQMQLPAEALLQYDEFRLYMPDLSDKEERKVRKARRRSKALAVDDKSPSLDQMADAGDFLGFRKKIRTEYDLTAILDIMRRYLFAREISLLFRMEKPVELLVRCQTFVKAMYAIMLRGLNELSEEEQNIRQSKAAMWVIQFSWDVKCASDYYFFKGRSESTSMEEDDRSIDTFSSDLYSVKSQAGQSDEAAAAKISEMLEISRLLLIELGDTKLDGPNPVRILQTGTPDDLNQPWEPWTPKEPSSDNENGGSKRQNKTKRLSLLQKEAMERQFLLQDCFSSVDDFEETYLELCSAIIKVSRKAQRRRFAARLQGEIAEYYVRKGDLNTAIHIFKNILKTYRLDQWDRCHFWRLFRLAYCQRNIAGPTEYLKTLVSCFSPRIALIAPRKALIALQSDLEKVLEHPSVGEARYGKLSFIETSMNIANTSPKQSMLGEGQNRKKMVKRFCSVGETVEINLSIRSSMPKPIELDSLKLFVVAFGEFASILENSGSIEEEDAFKTLSLESPVKLEPGDNKFMFRWSPSGAGQYILSTIEIVWKQGFFYYDSTELPDPLIGIDVLPSEPTHSISIDPTFLVPGHDQEILITFDAGSDVVTSGRLVMSCTNGILFIPPGEDAGTNEWKEECEIEFKPCKPGEKLELRTHVRCGVLDSFSHGSISPEDSVDITHGLSAKLFSTYLHSESTSDAGSEVPAMKTVLESFVPVLEKAALSVESVETHWLDPNERFILSAMLTSNTPNRFSVDSWQIQLPSTVKLQENHDLNQHLIKQSVLEGDQLSFAFECLVDRETNNDVDFSQQPIKLHLKLRDDAKKLFTLDLDLDTNDLWMKLSRLPPRKPLGSFEVVLKLENPSGPVGEPLSLQFSVTLKGFAQPSGSSLAYSIFADGRTWLVGGRVKGMMPANESASFTCEVVGIPMVPGILRRFPKMTLELMESDGTSAPVKVDIRYPDTFQSLSRIEAICVASSPFG